MLGDVHWMRTSERSSASHPRQERERRSNVLRGCRIDQLQNVKTLGDRFLSSAGAEKTCALPMRLPNPSPVLDKNRAPMGPDILSSTGAAVRVARLSTG